MRVEKEGKEWKYFVHYQGWNAKWDELIGADRILKYNDDNLAKKQGLEEEYKKQQAEKRKKSGASASKDGARPSKKRKTSEADSKVSCLK